MALAAIDSIAVKGASASIASRKYEHWLKVERKHTRCKICNWVLTPATLGRKTFVADCTTCNYAAVVCNDCGGLERAIKSVRYHVMYYVREKSIKQIGTQHVSAHRDFIRYQAQDRKLGLTLLVGGKR